MINLLTKYRFQFLLGLVWLVLVWVIDPTGNFAINDDWAYAINAREMSKHGVHHYEYWPAMTLVSQTYWGALFTKIVGFSLTNLRWATVVIAIIGSMFFYALLKRETKQEKLSFVLTIALLANPFFLSLSFTFMTEIYYLTFACIAFYFFSSVFSEEKWSDWVFLLIFVVLTILVRQTGVIYTIAFAVVFVLARPITFRRLLLASLPLIFAFGGLDMYRKLRFFADPSMGSLSQIEDLFRSFSDISWEHIIERGGVIFLYLGLILSPVSFLLLARFRERLNWKKLLFSLLFLVPILWCMFTAWTKLPYGNMLGNFELGPRLLKDTGTFYVNGAVPLSDVFWQVLRLVSVVSISIFVFNLYFILEAKDEAGKFWMRLLNKLRKQPLLFMIALIFAFQCAYIIINPIFFDRYIFPMMFTGLLLVGLLFKQANRFNWSLTVAGVSLFLVVSCLLSRDLMSWHRARLAATNYLMNEKNVPATKIDAGLEFNAYLKTHEWNTPPVITTDKSWWFVNEDDFLLTCGEFEGYRKIKAFPANQWISTSSDTVFIMEKIEDVAE